MGCDPSPRLSFDGVVPFETILCTDVLFRRPSRLPDHEAENHALRSLVSTLAVAPHSIPQALSETIIDLLDVGSAGIGFHLGTRWAQAPGSAAAGLWAAQLHGARQFAPIADAVTRATPLLLRRPDCHYPTLRYLAPRAEECLLVPVYVEEAPVGAIWAIAHDERRHFDVEDLRQVQSLSTLAAAACQTLGRLTASEERETGLRESQAHLEEEERALRRTTREKDLFIATLAHELRQPVGAMLSAVAVLRQRSGAHAESQARLVIERQVTHLRRLLDDLHDVVSIAAGKMALEREPLDARDVVADAVAAVAPQFHARGQALAVLVPDGEIPLHADRTRLQQVLTNLLTNAAKYTENGGRIALRAEHDGDTAVIEVTDNGRGISPGVLPHIFEEFVQEAGPGLHRSGLGIGLHVVRRLVELHGGTVAADSPGPGQGSRFIVRLPLLARRADGAA